MVGVSCNDPSTDNENTSKFQISIKLSILGIFFKIQIGVETRVNDLHFVSWVQTQKTSFLCKNFRFKVRENNFLKYTKLADIW